MKRTMTDIYHDILLFLLIINSKVLLFGNWDNIFRYITAGTSIFLCIIILFDKQTIHRIRPYIKSIGTWMILFFLFLSLNIWFCISKYGIGLLYALSQTYSFSCILLVFPVIAVISSKKYGVQKVIKELFIWGLISLIVRIIVWFLYNYMRLDIMHYLVFEAGYEWVRNDRQRIPLTCLTTFVLAYSLYQIYLQKKNIVKYIPIILLVFFYAQFVIDARAVVLRIVILVILAYWFSKRNIKSVTLKTFFIVLFVGIVFLSGVATSFYNSISDWSIIAREKAFLYYLDLVKQYPLTGVKLVAESTDLERGYGNVFYFNDIGTLAKFTEYGIIGGFLFIFPLMRMTFIIIKIKLLNYHDKFYLLMVWCWVVCACLMSNDIYFSREIFSFPFVLALFEYRWHQKMVGI